MKAHVNGQVIILTGASRGIGKGLALHLARAGATLVVTGRKPERLAELSAELDALGAPHIAQPLDQADREVPSHSPSRPLQPSGVSTG